MDIKYFYGHIMEELHGAKEYASNAVAVRASHPDWSKLFAEMSSAELDHAKKLFHMMDEYCNEQEHPDSYCEYKAKTAEYMAEEIRKIQTIHEMLGTTIAK